jgi:hypothetical protein
MMKIEICENCEREIGKLEKAYVFNGSIICKDCNQLLREKPSKITNSIVEEDPPTPSQIEYAKRLGINITSDMDKWELSDLISEAVENRQEKKVQTIEKTGKSYKVGMLIGIFLLLAAIAIYSDDGSKELSFLLGFFGILIFFFAKMFAWWYHG